MSLLNAIFLLFSVGEFGERRSSICLLRLTTFAVRTDSFGLHLGHLLSGFSSPEGRVAAKPRIWNRVSKCNRKKSVKRADTFRFDIVIVRYLVLYINDHSFKPHSKTLKVRHWRILILVVCSEMPRHMRLCIYIS
jgi:hypothetical protein